MKLFKLTLAIAIAFAAISYVDGTAAYGSDCYRTRTFGSAQIKSWDANNLWQVDTGCDGGFSNTTGHPDATTDRVLIRANVTVQLGGVTMQAQTVTIDDVSSAFLDIQSGGVLQIEDTLTIGTAGRFRFNDQTETTPPILRATNSLEIFGNIVTVSGADEGGVIAGEIQAEDTVRLMAGYLISSEFGPVAIEADFENDGTVTADGVSNLFDVTFSGRILDGSIGTFEVTVGTSEMIFNHDVSLSVPDLSGDSDFNVEAGLMHFQQSLTTAGGYRQIGGSTKANASKTFTANGAY